MCAKLKVLAANWDGREHLGELDMFIERDLVFALVEFVTENMVT